MSEVVGAMQQIEDNWRTGQCRMQRIQCRSEASKGVYCLQYDEQKIVSGLRDNTIKVAFQFGSSLWLCGKTPTEVRSATGTSLAREQVSSN